MAEIEEIEANDYRVLDLIRLALASEYHKRGLKRDEIFEKVCSTMRKIEVFKKVLIHTNTYLEENFAFKLVPLPVVSASVNVPAKTNRAKKSAVAQANKMANSKTSPPQMYSLVSTFTQKERSKFPATSRDPLRLAIIHTTLMIIKLSGNNVDRPQLVKALHEIQMCKTDSSELPLKDLDAFLEQLKKEKYILKERKNVTETEPVYSWGPRAFIEFPPKSMTDFLCTIANTNNKDDLEPKFMEKIFNVLSYE